MNAFRIGVVAVAALCAMPRALAQPCALALNSSLDLQSGLGMVEGKINDMPVKFELDTGAFTTVLSPSAVKRLKLYGDPDKSEHFRGQPDPRWTMEGIGGARIGDEVLAHSFDLGKLHGRNFHFLTADVGLNGADGLLSTDFLKEYDVDLDIAGHQIRLYRAIGSCSRPKVFLEPPLYIVALLPIDEDPRPRVKVTLDGKSLTALIDTGARGTVMFPRAAKRFGLRVDQPGTDEKTRMTGIGPRVVTGIRHVFGALTIGDLTIQHKSIEIADDDVPDNVDMLLGADFQKLMHLWLSNSSRSLVIQFPPRPSPDLP